MIPICSITSVLRGRYEVQLTLFKFFSASDIDRILINSSTLPLILCQKDLFEIFCIVQSLSQCKAIALTFGSCPNSSWASLIIACCSSVEEITRLVLLYINCPWSIEKIYKPFESWFSYLYIPLYTMDKCFYVNTFQFLQN